VVISLHPIVIVYVRRTVIVPVARRDETGVGGDIAIDAGAAYWLSCIIDSCVIAGLVVPEVRIRKTEVRRQKLV